MPPKRTTWDKAKVKHLLIIVGDDEKASRIEIGYDLGDLADATVSRAERKSLERPAPAQPPGPRFIAADALVASLIADVKALEGI